MLSFTVVFTLLTFHIGYSSATCSTVYERGNSQEDEQFIVNKHNELRLLIAQGKLDGQPRGTNLKRFKYSKELADKAQEIANTCVFAHQAVKGTQWGWVGQNIFRFDFSNLAKGTDWNAAIQGWWDEHSVYKFGSPFSKDTGHYTQLAWADTDNVGCGYTHYEANDGNYKYHKLYVCHYGPGGNIAGQQPYKTGGSGCENLC